jgi:hypothetical protein
LSFGLKDKNKINPKPLQTAKINEFMVEFKIMNGIARGIAPRLVIKNIIPLMRPRFSTTVESAKKDKDEGIPKPTETPKRKHETETLTVERSLIRAGESEVTAPNAIQK